MIFRLLVVCIALSMTGAALAGTCNKYCFRGSASTVTYDFSVVPCLPAKVLSGTTVSVGGVPVALVGEPVFSCQSDGQLVSLSLRWSVSRRFVWNYQSAEACAAVLSNLDTISGLYLGSDHSFDGLAVLDDADMSSYQILCSGLGSSAPCSTFQYSSGVVQLSGRAGDKSPCGVNGTLTCGIIVQFVTTNGGNCPAPLNQVTSLDVIVRPNNVPLSSFQPDSLLSPTLTCSNSQITLSAGGVTMVWPAPASDNSASCAVLMANIGQLAVSQASSMSVVFSNTESWSASGSNVGAALSTPAAGVDTAPVTGANAGADDVPEEPLVEDFVPDTTGNITLPITPTVYCNIHLPRQNFSLPRGRCCAIFGFINPNPVDIMIPMEYQRNWITPGPSLNYDNPINTFFAANTTEPMAFGWIWDCETYKSRRSRWSIRTFTNDNSTRVYNRDATAINQMNDCGIMNNTLFELCFPPPPTGYTGPDRR